MKEIINKDIKEANIKKMKKIEWQIYEWLNELRNGEGFNAEKIEEWMYE